MVWKMDEQEKYIAKVSVLNSKNLYRLLVVLRDMYPAGYMYENLKKRLGIKILPEIQLKELIDDGLLKLYDVPERFKQLFPEEGKMFPQYMIAKNGIEFLNNIEVRNLSKRIKRLTTILVVISIGLLIFSFMQSIISLWF